MTVPRRRAVWRWRTGSPLWSSGFRCRRMRFSCSSRRWLTWWGDWTSQKSSRPCSAGKDQPKVPHRPSVTSSAFHIALFIYFSFAFDLSCFATSSAFSLSLTEKQISTEPPVCHFLFFISIQSTLQPQFSLLLLFISFLLYFPVVLLFSHTVRVFRSSNEERLSLLWQRCWEAR